MMKTTLIALLVIALAVVGYTAYQQNNAITAPVSVATAKTLANDTRVILQGQLGQEVKDEHYRFSDATGEITLEMDYHHIRNLQLTPSTIVVVRGELERDKEDGTIEVDVDSLSVLEQN
jgi:uncharacterized protein (TIGR00156 family)